MKLDHGILNTPISQRGNTLFGQTRKQFDSQQKAEAKAAVYERRVIRERAKAIVDGLSDERMTIIAHKAGVTIKQARKNLSQEAYWNPNAIIRVFGESA